MNLSNRLFIITVIVVDLMAIIYFGGRFMLTGSILPHGDHTAHIVVEGADEPINTAQKAAPKAPVFDLTTYIPNIAAGQKVAAKCMACHGFNQGGKNKTGPNLWGIYGKNIAAKEGFNYSGVMSAKGGKWDAPTLNAFLEAPKKYMPGTKMQYNGIKKPAQRADLIAWLKTLQ